MTATLQGRQSSETFGALMKYFGFSDQRLADLTGYTRSQIEWRRKGKTILDVDDLERFSAFFGVPRELFLWSKPEALRWVLDKDVRIDVAVNNYGNRHNPSDLRISPSPCKPEYARRSRNRPPFVTFVHQAA